MFPILERRWFHDAIHLAQSLAQQTIGEERLPSARIVLEGKRLFASPFGQLVYPLGNLLGRIVLNLVINEYHSAKVRLSEQYSKLV